jgi:diadenosine tetraphosphate (Ap4A) HIT family hydrolase
MDECIFCKIVKGEVPSFKVWEDEKHIAFLDIFPAVEGMTLVVPKEHHDSYIMETDAAVMCNLMMAVRQVGKLLDMRLENVLRTKVVFEGVEVNHLHAKLLPMYRGELEIMEVGDRASNEELEAVAGKITGNTSSSSSETTGNADDGVEKKDLEEKSQEQPDIL